jgi:hypothetical protein
MVNNNNNKKNNLIALGLSLLGTAFLIYYIFRASLDVVASDYIRIINSYIGDVTDLRYLLSWEGISRIPFTFLARYINVTYFKYSVNFDRILGVFGLLLFNFITVKFILNSFKSNLVKAIVSVVVTFISFSLISWEMILNGTGYAHFLTVGIIALVFYLFDRISKRTKTIMTLENIDSSDLKFYGNKEENNRLGNMVALIDTSQLQRKNLRAHFFVYLLTAVGSLCFAGNYSVSFLCTLILFSVIEIFTFIIIRNKYNRGEMSAFDSDKDLYDGFKEQYNNQEIRNFGKFKGEKYSTVNNESTFKIFFKFLILIIISLICLSCYFKSNSTGEPLIPVGFKDISLMELIAEDPKFPIRFLLKSLASSIIGVETLDYAIAFKTINENMILFIGLIYVVIIFITLFVLVLSLLTRDSSKINIFDLNSYKNIFPLMFVVYGAANYVLVFLARYKFVRDEYGMSSRYGIQYMFFTIGIILILSFYIDNMIFYKKFYIKNKREYNLSKGYLKRREKLIAEGKIKPAEQKISKFNIVVLCISVLSIGILFFGHVTTTTDEIFKADYRKIVYSNLIDKAKNYTTLSDQELEDAFEYRRNPDHIRSALYTLKKQRLNIFKP